MIEREFIGRDKARAVRKAMDFWYRHFRDRMTLRKFLSHCTWRQEERGIIVRCNITTKELI